MFWQILGRKLGILACFINSQEQNVEELVVNGDLGCGHTPHAFAPGVFFERFSRRKRDQLHSPEVIGQVQQGDRRFGPVG